MRIEGPAVDYFMQWIGDALRPLLDEDADTDVLAKYIITLLSTDDDEGSLRGQCVAQLTDFLSDEAENFVSKLFEAIKRSPYKESLPSDTSTRFQPESEYDDHIEYRHSRIRRGDSDDDGSDDDRRYRRGMRRRYDDDDEDYDYANKRQRGSYGAGDRYSNSGREGAYAGRSRGPPPSNRYDRYDNHSRVDSRGHSGTWDHAGMRSDHQLDRGGRMGNAPVLARGMAPIPSYPSGGMGGDGYVNRPYYNGPPPGYNNVGMPPTPLPLHPPFSGSFNHYDTPPYDPSFLMHPAPPLPPMPRLEMGNKPPPPPLPRGQISHGINQNKRGEILHHAGVGDEGEQGLIFDGVSVNHGEESCTVRCTGIPHNVQEKDLFRHFKAFGRIASLKLLRHMGSQGNETGDGRKVYNECYVQFIDPSNAKKCVIAPSAVLNNRYIKVHLSNTNIVDPSEAVDVNISFARGYDGCEGTGNGPKDRAKLEALRKYEELKKLRGQEETILKKQEELIESQIEQHNKILGKLADIEDSDEKSKMTETMEAKILTLQFKLREVREKRESSRKSAEQATASTADTTSDNDTSTAAATSSVARFSSYRGRGAPRGRFGGRQAFSARGRGRFVRGRGNMSVDCRPKALLVSNVPDGFSDVADQHFGRFGKVLNVEQGNDNHEIVVEFSSRFEAEKALQDGAGYGGTMLSLEWAATPDQTTISSSTQNCVDDSSRYQQSEGATSS